MNSKNIKRVGVAALATVAILGGTHATGPRQRQVIHACVAKKDGVVRIAATCKSTENPVEWNQQGTQGLPGAQGAPGAPGAQGPQGEIGPLGPQGVAPDLRITWPDALEADLAPGVQRYFSLPPCPHGSSVIGRNFQTRLPDNPVPNVEIVSDKMETWDTWAMTLRNDDSEPIHVHIQANCMLGVFG